MTRRLGVARVGQAGTAAMRTDVAGRLRAPVGAPRPGGACRSRRRVQRRAGCSFAPVRAADVAGATSSARRCPRARRRHGLRTGRLRHRPPAGGVGHSVAVIDQDPAAFRRLGPEFAGRQVTGLGFDRQTLLDAGIDARRRVRRGQQRRQLQHHRARVARETFGVAARGRPHLRPQAGRGLRAAGHPDRRHRAVDGEPAAARAARRSRSSELWREPTGQGAAHADHRHRGLGRPEARRARGGDRRPGGAGWSGSARRSCPRPARVLQDGDQLIVAVTDDDRRAGVHEVVEQRARRRAALMRVAIAGAGAVGRSIAGELLGNGHSVHAHREGPGARCAPGAVPGRRVGAGRRLRAGHPGGGPARPLRRGHRAPPATTRSTWSSRCWPRPSSRSTAWWPGSRTRATSGSSPRPGASTSPSPPRGCSRRWSRRRSTVGDVVRLMTFRQGAANLVEITLAEDTPWVGQAAARRAAAPRDGADRDPARRAGHHPVAGRAARGRRRAAVRHPRRRRGAAQVGARPRVGAGR